MMDTEMRLSGDAAVEFRNMMTSVDTDSLNARDVFLADLDCDFNEQGVLSIDISDLDIDLCVMNDVSHEIEAVPVSKDETYIDEISVKFSSSISSNINIFGKRSTSYKVDEYYALESEFHVNKSVSIILAA